MVKIYIAGPYRAAISSSVDRNIINAREVQAELFRKGYAPFCPHSMTSQFERDYPDIEDGVYLKTGLEWLKACDAIYMLPGWEYSDGSIIEHKVAQDMSIRVYYSMSEVPDLSDSFDQ